MATTSSFGAIDYSVFIGCLLISLFIGIYFAVVDRRKKRNSPDDYFLASRSSSMWLVTLSFVVSFQSSLMILANPVEVYNYGMIYTLFDVGIVIAFMITTVIVVPVLYPLKLTSVNKYFFLRYGDNLLRYYGVFTSVVFSVFYMGTVIFGTCVAVEVIIGIPYWITVIVFIILTTIYTSIGGIKAVIWTDVFQFVIMTCGIIAVLVKSTIDSGGTAMVGELAGERLAADEFSFDPTVRYTVWNLSFGTFSIFLYQATSQSCIQRMTSTRNIKAARVVYLLAIPIYAITMMLTAFEGVTLYAYHASKGCDILNGGVIDNVNELLPFTITQLFKGVPGINGLFIASLSSAALSTISSCLSSLSAITYEDVVRVRHPDMDDKKATLLSKFTVLIYGGAGLIITFMIAKLPGSIINIFTSFMGCFDGPASAVLLISLLFKRGNSKGVFFGAVCGMAVSFWLIMGKTMTDLPADPQLPAGPTDTCWTYTNISQNMPGTKDAFMNYNVTEMYSKTDLEPDHLSILEKMYTVSYVLISGIGFIVTIIASVAVSYITKPPRCVEEKYMFSFRKHVLCDLFGKAMETETLPRRKDSFATEEMQEFIQPT